MIPEIEGKPFVYVDPYYEGKVFVCRRISGIGIADDIVYGECRDWVNPRPDGHLTEGFWISCDCLKIGRGWWLDKYFRSYFVFDPGLVARSLAGDHTWVNEFLTADKVG